MILGYVHVIRILPMHLPFPLQFRTLVQFIVDMGVCVVCIVGVVGNTFGTVVVRSIIVPFTDDDNKNG